MWRELPAETRDWSEEDWEKFFKRQDEEYFAEMQARASEHPGESDNDAHEALSDLDDDDLTAMECEYDFEASEDLGRIPAWRAAVEFCDRTIEFISPICEQTQGGPMEYVARTLCTECYLVPDYLLAGHEIGYEEDTLCGNIALCIRAYRSLERCIQCLERLGGGNDELCRKLVIRALITRMFVHNRIAELRNMVWWQ